MFVFAKESGIVTSIVVLYGVLSLCTPYGMFREQYCT